MGTVRLVLAAVTALAIFRTAASATIDAPPVAEAPSAGADIVCPEIVANARLKARLGDRPAHEQNRILERVGLGFAALDAEIVALYVHKPLSDAAIEALVDDGIRVARGLFVPPVVGRHSHGFHLARVEYTSLDRVRRDDRFVRAVSAAWRLEPQHDIGLEMVNIVPVHEGGAADGIFGPLLGDGVVIAVADSGVDLAHADLPTPIVAYDVTTGQWEDDWSVEVANTVIWHGTHATGTVVGSGLLSEGQYRGGAPHAQLIFHKIGNDTNGSSGDEPYTGPIALRVIWRDDGDPTDLNIELECLALADGEAIELAFADTSPRLTEAKRYDLWTNIPPQSNRIYTLRLTNNAAGGATPLVHVYQVTTNSAIFPQADPHYTVLTPAEADTVVAVGAWAHRTQWIDFQGVQRSSSQSLDTLATFSSRGPRIDGLPQARHRRARQHDDLAA